ncbi:MAG: hypothetical protein QM791_23050 [Ferruginibacter sp.]
MAQTTYLTQGDKSYQLIDRLEIKYRSNTNINYSVIKPYSRMAVIKEAEFFDSAANDGGSKLKLTPIDQYNLRRFYMNNSEWVTGRKDDFASEKPILKYFYQTKANFFEVNTKDFFLAINPVLSLSAGKESGNSEQVFLNTRGVTLRGRIANKIGFAASLTDNQERGPSYFRERALNLRAVPGYGYYKQFKKTGFDYFDVRGYFTFNVTKYIDVQFGHDKNFIGNGYRSLFLSDWGNSYLFLKLNTKIWKFNYENIFMELMPQFVRTTDEVLDRKYQVTHHLSFNLSKSVNIGLFEAVTFGRRNHFDFQYLNPVIFLRPVESGSGSGDKAKVGLDFKANAANHLQFYGQFLLDEFVLSKLKNDPTNYVNKYGYQLGVKYVDAFGVPNLDLQVESNRVRPFTYSHYDSVSNYTHYNQPLAHPLGANFQEFVGIVKYQPARKWFVYARAIYYYQGLDSAGYNFGGSPFNLYNDNKPPDPATGIQRTNGFKVGGGRKASCINALLTVTYEPWENVNFDLTFQQRNYKIANETVTKPNSTYIAAGIRINIFRREYDF